MANETKPDHGQNVISHAIKSFLTDVILWGVVKSAWSAITDVFVKQPAKEAVGAQVGDEHKAGDKHTFGEALTQLQTESPELASIIDQFMSNNGGPGSLRSLDERNDFIINAAKTGNDVPGTRKFLEALAKLPSHHARRQRLANITYIGEGEQDFFERHGRAIEHVKRYLRDEIRRTKRRNDAEDHDHFWSNYRRLRAERQRNRFMRGVHKTLDILFAR